VGRDIFKRSIRKADEVLQNSFTMQDKPSDNVSREKEVNGIGSTLILRYDNSGNPITPVNISSNNLDLATLNYSSKVVSNVLAGE
jgi:hypothetical protein